LANFVFVFVRPLISLSSCICPRSRVVKSVYPIKVVFVRTLNVYMYISSFLSLSLSFFLWPDFQTKLFYLLLLKKEVRETEWNHLSLVIHRIHFDSRIIFFFYIWLFPYRIRPWLDT
jgi:hypothetical protein